MWPFKKPEYIKLQRMSGRPVAPNMLMAYDEEFKRRFDEVQAKVGTDMEAFHKELLAIDADMKQRYTATSIVRMPKTISEVDALVKTYGSPVLFAHEAEAPHALVLTLMDEKFI